MTDTSARAEAVQLRIQRAMSGEERFLLALDMCALARALAMAGIRRDHPEWSTAQVVRELVRDAFGSGPIPRRLS